MLFGLVWCCIPQMPSQAPRTREEMRAYCMQVDGPKMANLLAGGLTPALAPAELEAIGFTLAAYPLELINASINSMREALVGLRDKGAAPPHLTLPFDELQQAVGFPEYYAETARYTTAPAVAGRTDA